MKKCITKIFAALLVLTAIMTSVQITAFANDMTLQEDAGLNSDYYSNIIYKGDDYVASLFQGVNKDKTIVVKKGEKVTLTYGVNNWDEAYGKITWSDKTTGIYHYGDNANYCISTDKVFTLGGDGVTATAGGFGSTTYSGNSNYGGSQNNTSIQTTFTIDTTSLEAKTYNLSLDFKYQLKKKGGFPAYRWSTAHEYEGTISGFQLIVLDEKMDAMGGSIRVANSSNKNISGLRFGFQTTESEDNIKEYGFLYSYDERNAATLTEDATGVIKTTASNYINHGDYTTFNLVFTGITSQYYDMKVSARSYVVTNDDVVHYSDVKVRSFKEVANNILSDPDVEQDTKDAIQKMLDSGSIDV